MNTSHISTLSLINYICAHLNKSQKISFLSAIYSWPVLYPTCDRIPQMRGRSASFEITEFEKSWWERNIFTQNILNYMFILQIKTFYANMSNTYIIYSLIHINGGSTFSSAKFLSIALIHHSCTFNTFNNFLWNCHVCLLTNSAVYGEQEC